LSLASSLLLVAFVIGGTVPGGQLPLAIYSLSFWHYYLYGLAYGLGAVSPGVFQRDAIVMKSISLLALGAAYLPASPAPLSLAVVGSGFLLNALGARALGRDRTYYGHEVAGLPRLHVVEFPYSWISHPMLLGNIAAFGGTLLDPEFRRDWWPLACGHVALNLGLLFMELAVEPQRRGQSRVSWSEAGRASGSLWIVGPGAALGWAAGSWGPWGIHALLGAALGAALSAHAAVLHLCYSVPAFPPPKESP
jgi:hypothetical protein